MPSDEMELKTESRLTRLETNYDVISTTLIDIQKDIKEIKDNRQLDPKIVFTAIVIIIAAAIPGIMALFIR